MKEVTIILKNGTTIELKFDSNGEDTFKNVVELLEKREYKTIIFGDVIVAMEDISYISIKNTN